MNVVQDIKSRLDIVDVVSDYVELRRSGRNLAGFCPFHTNTRTPAFYVSPERQTWRCFGTCAEGGDIFSFVMKREGWDFKETLTHLARKAGVELEQFKPKSHQQAEAEQRLKTLLTEAADYFHHLLLSAPEAQHARDYVAKRALDEATLAQFKIGYGLTSWDACKTYFENKGYTSDELLAVGLLSENPEKGTVYDRFRDRLIFPINDVEGQVVGFGARTLQPDGVPKYLNSPQTALFDKSRLLYGLDHAKRHIRTAQQAVIVEGYMDVIRAHTAGFSNVVAQMGTALTETQLRLLKRFSKRFVIALDADEAGARAMLRGLQTATESREANAVGFGNLLRLESPLKVEITAVVLPEGQDPDDLIRANPAQWPVILGQAQTLGDYVIATLTRDVDLNNPKAKSATAHEIAPFLHAIADPVEQDHYWQKLGRILKTDDRALRQIGRPTTRRQATPNRANNQQTGELSAAEQRKQRTGLLDKKIVAPVDTVQLEANFLTQCLTNPQLLAQVDNRLRQHKQHPVEARDFTSSEDRLVWQNMHTWLDQQPDFAIDAWLEQLEPILVGRVEQLLALSQNGFSVSDVRKIEQLPTRLTLSVLNCRLVKTKQLLSEVKSLMVEAQQEGDRETGEVHGRTCQELMGILYQINQAKFAMSAAAQR